MTSRISHDRHYRLDQNGWHLFRNDSGETIPPFAVLRIEGTATAFNKPVLTAYKPDGSTDKFYMVNGPTSVEANAFGQCTWGNPLVVAYDTADAGSVSVGSEWGAESGKWTLEPGGSNFWVIGTLAHSSLNLLEVIQDHTGATTETKFYCTGSGSGSGTGEPGTAIAWSSSQTTGTGIGLDGSNHIEVTRLGVWAFSYQVVFERTAGTAAATYPWARFDSVDGTYNTAGGSHRGIQTTYHLRSATNASNSCVSACVLIWFGVNPTVQNVVVGCNGTYEAECSCWYVGSL